MTEQLSENTEEKKKKRVVGKILFLSNWLFVVFFNKHFFTAPQGGTIFVVENLGTFLAAVVVTGLMYRFLSIKACLLAIPVAFGMALLAAVF